MTISKGKADQELDYTSLEDIQLIEQVVKNNDSKLFGILYDRYSNIVYNKCLSFVKSKDEAQDLTHDIFIKLFFQLKKFKGDAKFSTWLYSFTYNFCVNYVQRKYQKKKETFQRLDDLQHHPYEEIDDSEIYKMQAERLQRSLQSLDPNDKMVLLMKYMDGMSHKEIQQSIGVGESAVKMRINRAKQRLLDIYKNID
ncbi:RNA polymerase sigma factor [Echinicola vietnamensis]|uniref:RNA polymerase sigma factor, sigma-70 family n=1 Tax=Echinicola vietnamensis (strain DSM 17526 / LMG 23754 / KMM 6221) TaxID=926556 RepID=L0G6W6_ECHVK|nr:RNA polymerase sigma factor [Echinicola vietnamensis]AGA80751.1 RNA polymerase sigma factor, sigma-70 family [Echinicola vietnamensis DSM 17526]